MSKILAFVESRENKIKNSGFETASTALKLANDIGADIEVLLIGNNVSSIAGELGAYGIKKVVVSEDAKLENYSTTAYSKILAETAKLRGADIIILSASAMGKDISPRVSAKLEAGLVADCTEIKAEGGNITATRPVYAGKAFIDVKVTSPVKIFTLRPNVFKAVMSGEDARFMQHEGFDWKAIERAQRLNKTRKRPLGASTISMQTSKNTFLWHGRNYVRKGLEAYYTVLIEALWGKKRILEVYVNVIEWGDGIYGVEAASKFYFNKSASQLTQREAALLAAVIPNPRRRNPAKPTPYILKRASFIQGRMNSIRPPKE